VSPGRTIPRYRHRGLIASAVPVFAALGGLTVAAQIGNSGTGSSLGPSSVSPSSAASAAPSTVSGQVINAVTGLPVARALVRLNDRAVLTDHDGKFEFNQNTEANGNVMIVKPGFSSSATDSETPNIYFQGDQLAAPLRLLVYPEAVLTGTVLGPEGEPMSGITVNALRSLYDEGGRRVMNAGQAQTDSHGNFRIPVPAGSYRIETRYVARDQTTGLAVLPVVLPPETSSDTLDEIRIRSGEEQHFDLRPAVRHTHRVTATVDSSEHGVGSRITARSSNGSTLQINPTSNGSGEMTMELPQGTYTLTARRNNPELPAEAEATVIVPDHDISGVVFHFSPIPSIPVELLIDESSTSDNSEPSLQQFNLMLENDQPDLEQQSSAVRLTTLANHAFGFLAPPGSYHLQARGTGEWYVKSVGNGVSDVLQQGLVVAPGTGGTPLRVMVSNQTASLQGTVKLNGTPSVGWVYLIPTTPNAEAVISMRSNAEGAFTSAHLPPGSYQAIAFEHRHSANYRDPDVLGSLAAHVSSITVNAGDKATLNLDAVPSGELLP
jgi:Carboxypeptidase regulatory-like domain